MVEGDIVITTDIPLADRCLRAAHGSWARRASSSPRTRSATRLATRALLDMLRQSGSFGGGPAPFAKADRSSFSASSTS